MTSPKLTRSFSTIDDLIQLCYTMMLYAMTYDDLTELNN
jgi:hypothetical protein